jgi:hypothetical protein
MQSPAGTLGSDRRAGATLDEVRRLVLDKSKGLDITLADMSKAVGKSHSFISSIHHAPHPAIFAGGRPAQTGKSDRGFRRTFAGSRSGSTAQQDATSGQRSNRPRRHVGDLEHGVAGGARFNRGLGQAGCRQDQEVNFSRLIPLRPRQRLSRLQRLFTGQHLRPQPS